MRKLKPNIRSREYDSYSPSVRGSVAYAYLTTKKLGHREIDEKILQLDAAYTHGFQAMGILHYQGLYREHSGLLESIDLDGVISKIRSLPDSSRLLADLVAFRSGPTHVDGKEYEEKLAQDIENSYADLREKRLDRLSAKKDDAPRRISLVTSVFERDPDVIAEALFIAKGVCGKCKNPAPFLKKNNNQPYLEVHHIIPVAKGGKDNLSNVIALCPNCHRAMHFG